MTKPADLQPMLRILRCLIAAEILFMALGIGAGMVEHRFLPPPLQRYLESTASEDLDSIDGRWLAIGISSLVVNLVAWIALWQGWRIGRRLYTIAWFAFLPFSPFAGPQVQTGVFSLLETLSILSAGVILGVLYFSDLRQLYGRNGTAPLA